MGRQVGGHAYDCSSGSVPHGILFACSLCGVDGLVPKSIRYTRSPSWSSITLEGLRSRNSMGELFLRRYSRTSSPVSHDPCPSERGQQWLHNRGGVVSAVQGSSRSSRRIRLLAHQRIGMRFGRVTKRSPQIPKIFMSPPSMASMSPSRDDIFRTPPFPGAPGGAASVSYREHDIPREPGRQES